MVPVLVLLTLFVLWAGRGGRAGLTADLAAEEAATAAALCCEEGEAFESDRDALVADLLAARPGLQFLCIGGLRPAADPDRGPGAADEFVSEHWLEFEPSAEVSSGGVGVLGVRFACETDGAVAPLRGLFPTVTFHGQAAEVVVRRPPPPGIGFESSRFVATEGTGNRLVFKVTSLNPVPEEVVVSYDIDVPGSTATGGAGASQDCASSPDDYQTFATPGQASILNGQDEVEITVALFGDDCYEGDFETLTLEITGLFKSDGITPLPVDVAELDPNRDVAEGRIYDDDAKPYLFIVPVTKSPCEVVEADTPLSFEVRLRDVNGIHPAPNATTVTAQVATVDVDTTAGTDYEPLSPNPTTLTFNPGAVAQTVTVTIKDDTSSPAAEPDETFELELSNPTGGVPLGAASQVTCKIIDDEVRVTVANASADEGDDIAFELMLDRRPTANLTVKYDIETHTTGSDPATQGTATTCAAAATGVDNVVLSGDVNVPANHDPLVPLSLPDIETCQDDLVEADETFWLKISVVAPGEAVVPAPYGAVGTVGNDDIPVVSVRPLNPSGTEGNTVQLSVTLDDGSGGALDLQSGNNITVDYSIAGHGTDAATDPAVGVTTHDYSVTRGGASDPRSGTLTFTSVGPTSQHVFDVVLEPDYLKEPDETVRLDLDNLSDPVDATVFEDRDNDPSTDDSHADVTILDDPPPEFSVSDFTGDEDTEQSFTVTLARPRTGETAEVDYQIAGFAPPGGLAATDPATGVTTHDYTPKSGSPAVCSTTGSRTGTLSFPPNTTTLDVDVCLRFDTVYELDETLRLTLSNPQRAVLGDPRGDGTIFDVDAPRLYVDNVSANEGDDLGFKVALCMPRPNEDVTVKFATLTRSATEGSDYQRASGTLNFDATDPLDPQLSASCGPRATESKTQDVSVTTLADLIVEIDEDVHLVLSNQTPSHVALGKAVGVGRIVNLNPANVRVSDPSAFEGDPLAFEITLEGDQPGKPGIIKSPVQVNYYTIDRTASRPGDYTYVSSSVTFVPPTPTNSDPPRSHAVSVATSTDTAVEGDETMALRLWLSSWRSAVLADRYGIGTIRDRLIYLRIDNPAAVDEGNTVTFTVGLYDASGALTSSSETVTVDYAIADRTATAGSDYTAHAPGTLTFSPGVQKLEIDVATIADSAAEPAETFRVDLSRPVNAILDNAVGVGTIKANLKPGLRVSDASVRAGGTMTFTVTLDAASSSTVTVNYATSDGTAKTIDGDYTAASGTLTFLPGDRTATLGVATAKDSDTSDETFNVVLSGATNADIDDDTGLGTIQPAAGSILSIADASGTEGSDMSFVVTLNPASSDEVSFDVNTRDGTATAPEDYEPVADTTYRIAAGGTQTVVAVEIKDDPVDQKEEDKEYVETFYVDLSNPQNATIADGTAAGDIDGDLACVDMRTRSTHTLPTASVTGTSADEDDADGRMDLTLTVTQALCQDYELRFTVSDDTRPGSRTATLDADYRQPSSVRLGRGQTSVGFSVPLIDDDIVEGDETFQLAWAQMPGRRALPPLNDVYLTIVEDDESTLQLPADGTVTVSEGGWMSFVITLDKPSNTAVTFDYATSDGSAPAAAAGADYTAVSGSATISAGDLSVTIPVRTLQDTLDELDENVDLTVSNLSGATVVPGGSTATGVITDDDGPPSMRVSDASAEEGGALSFVVRLDAASGREVTVTRATRDDTAKAAATGNDPGDNDYTGLASGELVFAAGVTSRTVLVQTLTDSVVESVEKMFLDLSSPDGATLADSIGVGEIRDTSDRSVSVSDASVAEGGTLAFEVSFAEGASGRDVTVKYSTREGSAKPGADYDDVHEPPAKELKIVAGDTTATVLVPTVQDRLDEDGESLELRLSDPAGAVITDGIATGLIVDDDPEPALRVSDADASEDDGSAMFTLSLSEPSGRDVTVTYGTVDGTAKVNDGDYTAVPAGTNLTIKAGDRQATVSVTLLDDSRVEQLETFQLRVTAVVNAVLDDAVGVARITDDDGLIQILADDADEVVEATGALAVFTVRLSRAHPDDPVTVAYTTEDATATAGEDYTAASGTLTFAKGETTKTVSVTLLNDTVKESAETFRLVLSSPGANAELGDERGTALILDDDSLPTLSVADAPARTEGATATFTVTLSRASARAATVAYATQHDPTAAAGAAATANVDYTKTTGTLTIPARATVTTVTVPLLGDSLDEHTETFWLRLGSPTGASVLDGTAIGTINDDDPLPKIRIADASEAEYGVLRFDVSLDSASGRAVRVPWATKDLPAGPNSATAGSDYTAASGTATILAGATRATLWVYSLGDNIPENDERFQVQLGTPTNALLEDGVAVGTIQDFSDLPYIAIADATVNEDAGPAAFRVTLSRPPRKPVTVGYSTADVTATDPDDYALGQARTLTIPVDAYEGWISVAVVDDDLEEGTETFTVTLANPVNGVISGGAGTATGTIVDDESPPRISVSGAAECEDGSTPADCRVRVCRAEVPLGWPYRYRGSESYCRNLLASPSACKPGKCGDGKMEFPVTLSHASTEETSVDYSTFDGTATSPRDYVATRGTLKIPAGETSAKIAVTLVDDAIYEHDMNRTFRLRLHDPVGVELATVEAVGRIRDDEPVPRIPQTPAGLGTEANEGDDNAEHTIRLSHPSDQTVTVDYSFVDSNTRFCGLPIGDPEYYKYDPFDVNAVTPFMDATPGTISFAPGDEEQTISVPIVNNDLTRTYPIHLCADWTNGTYQIKFSNLQNAYFLRSGASNVDEGRGVIWDDEVEPYVETITSPKILESAGNAVFAIVLNRSLDESVVATFQTTDGTAKVGDGDYTSTKTTVTFPAGTTAATVSVPIIDDDVTEADETFTLRLVADSSDSNISHTATARSGIQTGTATIVDDEVDPQLSIDDTRANEDAGTMPFYVSLDRANESDVTVSYATADGTATDPGDYTAQSGTLTIAAGKVGALVEVPIIDDTDDTENDETFTLSLSNATGGVTIADASATATIVEETGLPVFTVADVSRNEGTGSEHYLSMRAESDDTCVPVDGRCTGITTAIEMDIRLIEVPSLGDEAATLGDDFAFCIGTSHGVDYGCPSQVRQYPVRLNPGWSDSKGLQISIRLEPDDVIEHDEKFQLEVANVSGATFTKSLAWGTILNDDHATVSVADVTASEADSAVVFTLQLNAPSLDTASFDYTTAPRPSEGDKGATPGEDYTSTSGTLSLAAGDTRATVTVPIIADLSDEFDETFLLKLSNPVGLVFRDTVAVGTIFDDDDGWWVDDLSVWENNTDGEMTFTIERDHTSTNAVTVNYRVGAGGSAAGGTSCTAGVDFLWPSGSSSRSGSVTVPAAAKSVDLDVTICDDTTVEGRENVVIELLNISGRKLTGVGTIVDNDTGN